MHTEIDDQLIAIEGIKWLPWIGEKYLSSKSKLMIIGESHYLWDGENGAYDILNDSNFTRAIVYNNHQQNLKDVEHTIKPLDGIERTILNSRNISLTDKVAISDTFVYHVIVQKDLSSRKERPNYNAYYDGWKTLIEIAKKLEPKTLLAIGVESYDACVNYAKEIRILKENNREAFKINRTYPRKCKIEVNGNEIVIIFMRHASSFYSWSQWHTYLAKYFNIEEFKNDLN